jgi:transcriptional regulator with XRE-family HTH domain
VSTEIAGPTDRSLGIESERRAVLRGFLRDRRARLQPEDVGLSRGGHRRSPGLRREEVAILAGMSVNWYAQLESGANDSISPAALDSVARTLHLSEPERIYLGALTRVPLPAPRHPDSIVVPDRLIAFLAELKDRPAVIWNRCRDAVAWNAMTASIFHYSFEAPSFHRNGWWRIFKHPNRERIWADWDSAARRAVAALRWQFSRDPEAVYDLLLDLQQCNAFRDLWERDSAVTDWMLAPAPDVAVQIPDRPPLLLEPVTLSLPNSDEFLIQIHRRCDAETASLLSSVFAMS